MLDRYPLCHLTRADLLRDLGRCQEAGQVDGRVLARAVNSAPAGAAESGSGGARSPGEPTRRWKRIAGLRPERRVGQPVVQQRAVARHRHPVVLRRDAVGIADHAFCVCGIYQLGAAAERRADRTPGR